MSNASYEAVPENEEKDRSTLLYKSKGGERPVELIDSVARNGGSRVAGLIHCVSAR